jgi:hypothetical protein
MFINDFLQKKDSCSGVLHAINLLFLMANLNFMTIEVHSSEYIHLALCTHTLCRDNPAMLFPLLYFFLRMNFIQALGVYPPRVFANHLLCACACSDRYILHAGESANPLNIFFSRAAFAIKMSWRSSLPPCS